MCRRKMGRVSYYVRLQTLEKFKTGGTRNNMGLSIPLSKSPSGKTYREYPNEDCSPKLILMGSCLTVTNRLLIIAYTRYDYSS